MARRAGGILRPRIPARIHLGVILKYNIMEYNEPSRGTPMRNPFSPTAGFMPLQIVDCDRVLFDFETGLEDGPGAEERFMLLRAGHGQDRAAPEDVRHGRGALRARLPGDGGTRKVLGRRQEESRRWVEIPKEHLFRPPHPLK